MNKNTSTIAVVAVIVVVALFFMFRGGTPATEESARIMEMSAKDVLASASVHIPDTQTTVTLKDGSGAFSVVPGGAEGAVSLEDFYADQVFVAGTSTSATSARDLFGIIDVSSGGSGTFKYLAHFRFAGTALEHKSSFLIGDRVKITGVTADKIGTDGSYVVTVQYLDRKVGEAMAVLPSVSKTATFTVKDGVVSQKTTAQTSGPTASYARTVTYTDNGFSPAVVTIHKGGTVTFVNRSGRVMWVASDPHARHSNYPEFDDRDGKPIGGSYTFKFLRTGSFGYHSEMALFHTGTIIVLP